MRFRTKRVEVEAQQWHPLDNPLYCMVTIVDNLPRTHPAFWYVRAKGSLDIRRCGWCGDINGGCLVYEDDWLVAEDAEDGADVKVYRPDDFNRLFKEVEE